MIAIDYKFEIEKQPQKHLPTEKYITLVLPIVLNDKPAEIKRSLVKQAINRFFPR